MPRSNQIEARIIFDNPNRSVSSQRSVQVQSAPFAELHHRIGEDGLTDRPDAENRVVIDVLIRTGELQTKSLAPEYPCVVNHRDGQPGNTLAFHHSRDLGFQRTDQLFGIRAAELCKSKANRGRTRFEEECSTMHRNTSVSNCRTGLNQIITSAPADWVSAPQLWSGYCGR